MTATLTIKEAREAARAFVHDRIPTRWTVYTVERYLPRGWYLRNGTDEADFYPITITNVTRAMRRHATRDCPYAS